MEMEKYTERSKGFIQSAQNMALRSGHQRLMPEHLLKVLLEDKEGLCANLVRAAGGDPQIVLAGVDAELDKQPKVEGAGAGQVYLGPEQARIFLRHHRAAAARAGAGEGDRGGAGARQWPGDAASPQRRDREYTQGAQGRKRLGRRGL